MPRMGQVVDRDTRGSSISKKGHGLCGGQRTWRGASHKAAWPRPAFHRFHARIKKPELMKAWQLRLAALRGGDDGNLKLPAVILNRAIEDVLRGGKRLAKDALEWFNDPKPPCYLYTFESICDQLDLPSAEIRRDVMGWWEERCRTDPRLKGLVIWPKPSRTPATRAPIAAQG